VRPAEVVNRIALANQTLVALNSSAVIVGRPPVEAVSYSYDGVEFYFASLLTNEGSDD